MGTPKSGPRGGSQTNAEPVDRNAVQPTRSNHQLKRLRPQRHVVAVIVLHKTYAGLRDAYRYTGNRTPWS